jgi:ABC-type amino acid transport substrate-binding protein
MRPLTRTEWILLGVAGILIVIACLVTALYIVPALTGNQPATTPVPSSTLAPPVGEACSERWQYVQQVGKLVVGTSADYPPFEFYNSQYQIDGFDPALIRAIGQQLGLAVEVKDFAFDGLGAALQLGQIDVAISAISVTPERQAVMDFTNPYYFGMDAVLAGQNSSIASITAIQQMAPYRVGVQSGSVYQGLLKSNLVDTGLMPAGNLYSYPRVDQAINDLRAGLIDLVMLDGQPAQDFAAQGGVKIVGGGINTESYAIAMCKDSGDLLKNINRALDDLNKQGAVTLLSQMYLNQSPNTTPAPTPQPTATLAPFVPTSTPQPPPPCLDSMAFVADINLPDYNMKDPPNMNPGQAFTKGWRIRNNGTCTWTSTYSLDYVYGSTPAAQMGGQRTYIQGSVPPGGVYDIYVPMVAPIVPGTYQGFWQMLSSISYPFGQKIWVGIEVVPFPTSTPPPTQTPSPSINFSGTPTTINQGDPVYFTWTVNGAQAVYFYAQGQPWQDYPVGAQGSRTVYPAQTTTYELRVVWKNGTVEVRQVLITVLPPPQQAPKITLFSLSPPTQIYVGECVNLQWVVEGQVNNVSLQRSGQVIWSGAPNSGSYRDCPTQVGQVVYTLEASGPGGVTRQQQALNVLAPPPTEQPTATPTLPAPIINSFVAEPTTVSIGTCLSLSWSVGGAVDDIKILRNDEVIMDGANYIGIAQDCPTVAGQLVYTLFASNVSGLSDSRTATVSVIQPK